MFLTFGFPIIYLIYICFFIYRLREIKAIVDVSQRKWKITVDKLKILIKIRGQLTIKIPK